MENNKLEFKGSQVKSARNLLNWDQNTLAKESGLTTPTISKIENEKGIVMGQVNTLRVIISTLESNGIRFTGDMKKSIGVMYEIPEHLELA